MRFGSTGLQIAIGLALTVAGPLALSSADAKSRVTGGHGGQAKASAAKTRSHASYGTRPFVRYIGGGLQCVPFARENSGIELTGNANTWWNSAEGVYERGARPEVGSVLNFRANGRMRMGHVAVVANVIDGRRVEIDHANWAGPGVPRGGITRNIDVVDVSERNDWSAVRVALGNGGFGSVYPTYGFIYDRPDKGTMVANHMQSPAPVLDAAPRDLRPVQDRTRFATIEQDAEEVAEADDEPRARSRRHVPRAAAPVAKGKMAVSRIAARSTAAVKAKPIATSVSRAPAIKARSTPAATGARKHRG